MAVFGRGLAVTVETAVEPAFGQGERLGGIIARRVARRALVESHHDVGADRTLRVDHAFGREQMARTVDMGLEMTPLLLKFAAARQREDLKAAAVGEHRPVPGREAVHAARPLENIHTGTQIKVVGVGQDDLGPGFVAHVAVEDTLDGRRRTYGHEDRGLHHAVIGLQFTRPRLRRRVFMLERKFHRCLYNVQKYAKLFIIHKKWSQQCASRSCRGRSVRREGRMVKSRREITGPGIYGGDCQGHLSPRRARRSPNAVCFI